MTESTAFGEGDRVELEVAGVEVDGLVVLEPILNGALAGAEFIST